MGERGHGRLSRSSTRHVRLGPPRLLIPLAVERADSSDRAHRVVGKDSVG
jgi:hypothetical protein